MKTTMLLSALFTGGILFSGCSSTSAAAKPTAGIEAKFKNSIEEKSVREAVLAAAEKTDWSIASDADKYDDLILGKVYEKRKAVSSHPAYRGKKKIVKEQIYAKVDIFQKGFKIQLTDADGNLREHLAVNEAVSRDLKRLEEAIYIQLVPEVL